MDCRADQHRIRASINTPLRLRTLSSCDRRPSLPHPCPSSNPHTVTSSASGTDLMATDLDAADSMCDALNSHVDLNREQWKCLASAVFVTVEMAKEHAASETEAAALGRAITTCDPDEPVVTSVAWWPDDPVN